MPELTSDDLIQMSANGDTVWVHSPLDGSTVGRFDKRFGMDAHTTVTQQLEGASQCLHCTHEKPSQQDWLTFCELMAKHHQIEVDPSILRIDGDGQQPVSAPESTSEASAS